MRFPLDMGVEVRVATWLREHGHDPLHLRFQGLQRLPSGEVFPEAISENPSKLSPLDRESRLESGHGALRATVQGAE